MKHTLSLVLTLIFLTGSVSQSFASIIIPYTVTEKPFNPERKTISSAVSEFRHLSKKERKSRIKEAKAEFKKFKAEKRAGSEPSTNQVLLIILAIILPPLAVYLHQGEINNKFWLDLVLTLLFFLPGIIYALIVILSKD